MDLASLPPNHLPGLCADGPLSPADSLSQVCSASALGPCNSALPCKAIGQRCCVVDHAGESVSAESDTESCDAPDRLPVARQQTPEPQDGDGLWQVVTRRRSRPEWRYAQAGKCDARVKGNAPAKRAAKSHSPENRPADNQTIGQNQRQQVSGLGPLLSSTPSLYWPLCIKSFARLGEVDWNFFDTALMKCRDFLKIKLSKNDFRHFHRIMTSGPRAISQADDTFFLVAPFKVLLSEQELLADAVFLSLMFECAAPGFLPMLGGYGGRFVTALVRINRKHGELFTAITDLLVQICQENECWPDRFGWQNLQRRHRCNLFLSMVVLFKQRNKIDLVCNLHKHVNGSWLEVHYYRTVRKLLRDTVHCDGRLRDLKASISAMLCWLEDQFSMTEERERYQLIDKYAHIVEKFIEVTGILQLQPSSVMHSMWTVVAQFSVRFRLRLSDLEVDRTIALLSGILHEIQHWRSLDGMAFELRLSVLWVTLRKCEDLALVRDCNRFSQAWSQHESTLNSLLVECNQFMGHYQPITPDVSRSLYAQRKQHARMDLTLRESAFYRLRCEIGKTNRQQLEENLQRCRTLYDQEWSLSPSHFEQGVIELAKWYFLARHYDQAVSALMGVCCNSFTPSWKKANLLARYDVYQQAIDEFHHTKSLITDSGQAYQDKRDKVDNRIAMTYSRWYTAEGNTEHLISAFRLSVDVLGRCDVENRSCFEGVLAHIVNAMKNSGLRFEEFVEQTLVLDYLVKDGYGIKSWHHFVNLLHVRHKVGLTNVNTVDKVASEISEKHQFFLDLGKKS